MKTGIAERLRSIRRIIAAEYLKQHSDPWIVAYSGGKDSTLLIQLVWEMLVELPPECRRRSVHVVANDTLVESPMVIDHLRKSVAVIRETAKSTGLPIDVHVTKPAVDQTFWVNVIGRGYVPPTRNFRWCTDRMKILPTNRLIARLLARHQRAVLLVGTRRSESRTRSRNMAKHGVRARRNEPPLVHPRLSHVRSARRPRGQRRVDGALAV